MFKRIFLFLLTNIAIMVVLSTILFVLSILGVPVYGNDLVSLGIYSLVVGFTGSFISLLLSRWMAKKAYNITLIDSSNFIEFSKKEQFVYSTVERLAQMHHIRIPEVGVYEDVDPNAFATGASKNKALVAVSTGLLNTMSDDEIEGVIGHELGHILNGDMVTMTLLQGVLNTFIVFLSRIISNIAANAVDEKYSAIVGFLVNILLQILLGILASLIAMGFSRYREFKADEASSKYLGKQKMISALKALQRMQNLAGETDNLSAFKISSKKSSGIMALFSSHPNLEARIKNLETKMF